MASRAHILVVALDARGGFLDVPRFAVEEDAQ
jgi:hypothetical protein